MNLIVGAPWWLIFLLAAALIAAGVEDVVRLRISNVTCGSVLLLCVIAMAIRGFPIDLWRNVVVFVVILAVGTLGFSARLLGGGDVKLLASLGLWLDVRGAIWFLAAVFIAGGVLALLLIAGRLILKGPVGRSRRKQRVPYGIAIAAGAVISFTATRVEQSHQPLPLRPVNIVPSH